MKVNPTTSVLKIAVLATHPIQYQAPLWRKLALREDLKIRVYFGSDLSVRGYRDEGFGVKVRWDVPLLAEYEHTFLSQDPTLQRISFWQPRAAGLRQHLNDFQPDVVLLTAYHSMFWIEALLAARLLRVPVVLRHEASDAAVFRSRIKGFVRDQVLRLFYSQVARFAAIGTQARKHLLRLGVSGEKIGWSPYCVDSEQIEDQVATWRPRRDELRAALGIAPGDTALVFSGKLIEKKQVLLIPEAVGLLREEHRRRLHLIVLGDGDQKTALEKAGREIFGARLHMPGFVNQSEMGRWYAAADCLVLPSKKGAGETWGLVVNEALQFGIPAVVSDGVGCAPDLIDDFTGRIFRAGLAEDLARALSEVEETLLNNKVVCAQACRQKVAEFSLATAENGLAAALKQAGGRRPDIVPT